MFLLLGLVGAVFFVLYKRSTQIITVETRFTAPASRGVDFSSLLGSIQQAAEKAAQAEGARLETSGLPAIRAMVRNQQFVAAIQRYQQVYGVDARAAKKAIDGMMREG